MNYEEQKQFCLCDDKGNPKKPYDSKIVDYIKANYPLFVLGGSVFVYESGVYSLDVNDAKICSIIKSMIPAHLVDAYTLKRICKLFLMDAELQRDYEGLNLFPDWWVCFRDCFYDVKTGERIPHDSKYYCINQIPHDCPAMDGTDAEGGKVFEKFLAESMGADDIETILQFLGWCLTKDNSFQKFCILTGGRATGKSTLLRLFAKIIGSKNISAIPIQRIQEKFFAILMLGKLANVCADLPNTALSTVDRIKQITGGDLIVDSFKGKDSIAFTPYCKLIFSANSVPISLDEKSSAFFERVIIIRMDHRAEKPDRCLDDKLKAEIPYILKKCLLALRELYENGSIYESESSKNEVEILYRDSDSVKAFLFAHTKKAVGDSIKTTELFKKYKEFCEDEERIALSRNGFYRNIAGKGIAKKTIHGVEYFDDIGWKSGDENTPKTTPEGGFFPPPEGLEIPFDI